MTSKKSNYFPLKFNLSEVQGEPLEFNSSREHGELDQVLKDLVGHEPYQVHLSLEKTGNAYLLKGDVVTSMPLTCSDCGGGFLYPIQKHFEEILVIQNSYQKGDHAARNNHAHEWNENQPSCTYLESSLVDLGELIHEQLALLEPFRPEGHVDPSHICENLREIKRDWLSWGKESGPSLEKENPFKALEGLKKDLN